MLASLLTQQGQDGKIDPARIYEAFGPFGIRFAQMVARWDLFGPEHSRKIEHLKYRAKPLSLSEIEQIARRTLSADEFAQIEEFIERKGSGTNRAVVQVRLRDGGTPVMLVQRPYAREQIEGITDLLNDALIDAKSEKLFDEIDLVDFLIHDTKAQMLGELNGQEEVVKIRRAKKLYDTLNEDPDIIKALNGYHFVVPQPLPQSKFKIYDNLIFLENFDGMVLGEAPQEVQDQVGKGIVLSTAQSRILYGAGDVDRHKGNFMVNPKERELAVIDTGGWWYELSEADRLAWRDFLIAASKSSETNPEPLLEAGLKLAVSQPSPEQKQRIREGIREAMKEMSRESPKRGALLLQKAFELNGARMRPQVKFAGLMETLVLSGERYTDSDTFQSVLEHTIARSLISVRKEIPGGAGYEPELSNSQSGVLNRAKGGLARQGNRMKAQVECIAASLLLKFSAPHPN